MRIKSPQLELNPNTELDTTGIERSKKDSLMIICEQNLILPQKYDFLKTLKV